MCICSITCVLNNSVLPSHIVFLPLCINRQLYEKDGHFAMSQIPYWAHVVMYGGFIVSGIVDLIGYYTPLPAGTEQVRDKWQAKCCCMCSLPPDSELHACALASKSCAWHATTGLGVGMVMSDYVRPTSFWTVGNLLQSMVSGCPPIISWCRVLPAGFPRSGFCF